MLRRDIGAEAVGEIPSVLLALLAMRLNVQLLAIEASGEAGSSARSSCSEVGTRRDRCLFGRGKMNRMTGVGGTTGG